MRKKDVLIAKPGDPTPERKKKHVVGGTKRVTKKKRQLVLSKYSFRFTLCEGFRLSNFRYEFLHNEVMVSDYAGQII